MQTALRNLCVSVVYVCRSILFWVRGASGDCGVFPRSPSSQRTVPVGPGGISGNAPLTGRCRNSFQEVFSGFWAGPDGDAAWFGAACNGQAMRRVGVCRFRRAVAWAELEPTGERRVVWQGSSAPLRQWPRHPTDWRSPPVKAGRFPSLSIQWDASVVDC